MKRSQLSRGHGDKRFQPDTLVHATSCRMPGKAAQHKLSCHKCRAMLNESAVSPWGHTRRSEAGTRILYVHAKTIPQTVSWIWTVAHKLHGLQFACMRTENAHGTRTQAPLCSFPPRSFSEWLLGCRCVLPTHLAHSKQLRCSEERGLQIGSQSRTRGAEEHQAPTV